VAITKASAVDLLFQVGGDGPNQLFLSKRMPLAMRGLCCMLSAAICVAWRKGIPLHLAAA